MILFIILLLTSILLIISTILVVSVGGTVFIVLFGDVIVCIFIIIWIMNRLIKNRNK